MSEKGNSPVGVGVLTVLTVLLVLVLAVFSALTYATANADTVTAWYAADAQAAALLEEFEAGSGETLEATLPMTERQSLYVRFQREADGTVTVLDWRTVLTEEAEEGSSLPVYGSEG